MSKDGKERVRKVNKWGGKIEKWKRNMKIIELKSKISKMKILLNGFNNINSM